MVGRGEPALGRVMGAGRAGPGRDGCSRACVRRPGPGRRGPPGRAVRGGPQRPARRSATVHVHGSPSVTPSHTAPAPRPRVSSPTHAWPDPRAGSTPTRTCRRPDRRAGAPRWRVRGGGLQGVDAPPRTSRPRTRQRCVGATAPPAGGVLAQLRKASSLGGSTTPPLLTTSHHSDIRYRRDRGPQTPRPTRPVSSRPQRCRAPSRTLNQRQGRGSPEGSRGFKSAGSAPVSNTKSRTGPSGRGPHAYTLVPFDVFDGRG